jgi:hypothetical protein
VKEYFVPCGLAAASVVQFIGTRAMAPLNVLPRGAVGVRLEADVPLRMSPPRVFLVPGLDVLGAFGRTFADPSKAINLSQVNARLGAGLTIELGSP